MYDIIIKNGRLYDGSGSPSSIQNIAVKKGVIDTITDTPIKGRAKKTIDAKGHWVMPGFIDFHTHYDAEVEAAPALSESIRHGVTTVTLGSCSLSLAIGEEEDLADMFSRVEAIPRESVLGLLKKKKKWNTLQGYVDHLNKLPLGPNITSFIGHSAIRAHVMGLGRSLDKKVKPDKNELNRMRELVDEALDCGFLGMSVNTLTWDKMDGSRFRSEPLPSTFARWKEFRYLTRTLRKRDRVFQGVPNVSTKYNVILFMAQSMGILRKKLKTTIISLMDVRSNRTLYRLIGALVRGVNKFLGADFRLQALPEIFDLYADGVDVVVFEEFGAGTAAIHLADMAERRKLLLDNKYRAWFRKQWTNWFLPRVFHRDFNQSKVVECPDKTLVGKSFTDIAKKRNQNVVEVFLDLCAEFGNDIRWYTIIGNDREKPLQYIMSHPDVLIGFSDAGAHLRGMAHYNFPLRMLKKVYDAEKKGKPFMTVEKAVWRLTGEIADWFEIDAGHLKKGARADLVIVNPDGLADNSVEEIHERPVKEFGGIVRLVRRNDKAVKAVLINGKSVFEKGRFNRDVGKKRGYGRFIAAGSNKTTAGL